MAFLQITASCDAARCGQTFDLLDDETLVGRDVSCALHIEDPSISRQHARLVRSPEGWVVTDLGSSNGTRVNGERVTSVRLEAGDELRVGNSVLLLHDSLPVVDLPLEATAVRDAESLGRSPRHTMLTVVMVLAGVVLLVVAALLLSRW